MNRFGEYLIEHGLVSPDDLTEALDVQRYQPKKIGRILQDFGAMGSAELNRALAMFLGTKPTLSIQELKEKVLSGVFSAEFVSFSEDLGILPLVESSEHLAILSTEFDDNLVDRIEKRFGKKVDVQILDLESFAFIERHLRPKNQEDGSASSLKADSGGIFKHSPYSSLFWDLVRDAKSIGASDIHIQPTRDGVDIRFRIDGDLKTQTTLALEHRLSFINEVKRLSGLSVAISGRTQDGRMSFNEWKLDLRSSLLPSQFGEKVVLRLLDRSRQFELSAIGFDETTEFDLRQTLEEKSGVAIVSGPTGSGKTTTLYTLLSEIDRKKRNVLTLEDPIEYSIEGITQVQVSPKLSFGQALRSVLRQDPDVILVGEIRDAETADLCVKAASTGHLVLSTVHANSAADVVGRLLNLGVDRFLLKSVLKLSSAQRLVKRLCDHCSLPLVSEEIEALSRQLTSDNYKAAHALRKRNESGCPKCRAGIVGRVSILEYARSDGEHRLDSLFDEQGSAELNSSLQYSYFTRALKGEVDATEYRKIG